MKRLQATIWATIFTTFATGALADGEKAKIADTYRQTTYKTEVTDVNKYFEKGGVNYGFNPKQTDNPDPEWVTGWDQLKLTDETKTALIQAAANRTWTAEANAEFAAFWKGMQATQREVDEELQKIAKMGGTVYERIGALHDLSVAVGKKIAERNLQLRAPNMDEGHPLAFAGPYTSIATALAGELKAIPFHTARVFSLFGYGLEGFATHGRAFGDEATERTLYLRDARKNGTFKLAKLPDFGGREDAVRWPYTKQEAQAAKQARAKLIAASASAFPTNAPRLDQNVTSAILKKGQLGYLHATSTKSNSSSAFVVRSFKAKDLGGVMVIEFKETDSVPYNCKGTGKHLDDFGNVHTSLDGCSYRKVETVRSIEADFAELPKGIEVGDAIEGYGEVISQKETKSAKGTTYSAKVKGIYVSQLTRKGKVVLKH